jgi:hypothetical protein
MSLVPYMKLHSVHLTLCASLLASASALAGGDGDAPALRKQFRQARTYPYIFQSESYLAATGPAPIRIAPGAPHCSQRKAPPLLAAAQGHPKAPAAPPPVAPLTETTVISSTQNPPAYAAPATSAATVDAGLPSDSVDFTKPPEEVLEFFRTTDGKAGKRIYLFDPIFQPAKPTTNGTSKATYTQKP